MEKRKATNLMLSSKLPIKLGVNNNKKEECNLKELKTVSSGCYHIFNGKKLSNSEFVKVFETIRQISNAEVGLKCLVSQHFEEAILKKGMDILREEIKDKPGHTFLVKLGDTWTNFYQNILPTLQALFCNIPTHKHSVKHMTLMSYRNLVVLQLKVDEALSANEYSVPKSIKHMLCILLQAVHDNSEQYYKLETLTARVINPFLGSKGLYTRSEVLQEYKASDRYSAGSSYSNIAITGSAEQSPEIPVKSFPSSKSNAADSELEDLMNFRRQKYNRFPGNQRLSCVEEKEKGISESLASLLADGFEIAE